MADYHPEGKGKLVYEEEWAKTRKFKDRSHLVFGPLVMGMGVVLVLMGIGLAILGGSNNPAGALLFLTGIGAFVILLGFSLFRSEVKTMPFRVYENGFTLPSVPMNQGIKRIETFIDWSRLDSASLDSYSMYTAALRQIKFIYDNDEELKLSVYYLTDPFVVMKALKRFVPEKMASNFNVYVGSEEERNIITKPMPLKASKYKWGMPLLMGIFMLVMSGSVAPSLVFDLSTILPFIMLMCIFGPVAALMFYLSFDLEKHSQKDLIHYEASATQAGIEFPKTLLGRVIRNIRTTIPYDEIKMVRMKLEPLFYSHEAEFETTGGERFWVPFKIYQKVSTFSEFELKGYDYVNKSTGSSRGPIITTNKPRTALLIGLLSCTFFTGFLFSGFPIDAIADFRYVCILLVFVILLPILLFSYWVMGKRNMTSRGIMASDKGIFLPNASEKFHYIPKNEVISVKIEKDLFGYYCLLNTVKGTQKLNQVAAENLISGGYRVENAQGLGQIPIRGFKEGKKPELKEDVSVSKKVGRGSLLLEESPESFRAKKKKLNLISFIMMVAGVVMAVVPLFLIPYFSGGLNVYLCFPWMFVLLGCVLIGAGAFMLRTAKKAVPIRIYENGIIFSETTRKEGGLFVPYGRIKTYTEVKIAIWGDVVQFHLEGATKFMIQKSMPGFLPVFDEIKDRIGKPEYDSEDFELISKETHKKLSFMLYGAVLALGYSFAFMYVFISGYSTVQSLVSRVLMFGSAFSIVILPYMIYSMEFKKETIFKGKANPKMIAAMLVVLLILFGIGWATQVSEPTLTTIHKDSPPETYAISEGEIEGTTELLSDNIYVPARSSLTIVNSTVVFATTFNKQYSIFIEEGGFLEVVNSSIRTNNILFGFGFEIHGSARLIDSSFSRLYGSEDVNNGDGGLEIFSDDVLISNCSISHNKVNGLLIADSSPTIENCIIANNEDDGIEMQNADPVIRNCTIRENGWAVIVNAKSNPHIEGNLFDSNAHGIDVYGSKATIINNEFRNNENYAINVYDNSEVTLRDNTYENNEENVTSEMPFAMFYSICSAVVVIIGLIATVVVISLVKSRRKRGEEVKKDE